MRFRPCIDLHGGKVKQIVGGTLRNGEARENYTSPHDAAWFSRLYREKGLDGGHVIKLGPGNDAQAREALAAWPGGLQVGGGIDRDNAARWLDAGASHVIVTSCLFSHGKLDRETLGDLSREVGANRLVLDLSCRRRRGRWTVVTDRWQTFTDYDLTPESLDDLARYCDEFLIHGVDVEGKRNGIEEELVTLLSRFDGRPITYAGGISSREDIERIRLLGKGKIDYTVGSALDIFGGNLPIDEINI